jgi:hypothetical protein
MRKSIYSKPAVINSKQISYRFDHYIPFSERKGYIVENIGRNIQNSLFVCPSLFKAIKNELFYFRTFRRFDETSLFYFLKKRVIPYANMLKVRLFVQAFCLSRSDDR